MHHFVLEVIILGIAWELLANDQIMMDWNLNQTMVNMDQKITVAVVFCARL